MKSLLLSLFLYLALIWAWALYGHPDETRDFGLRWTIYGLAAVFVFVVVARLWGWWRSWRAKMAARPAAPPKSAPVVHEDAAALAALIAEANASLAKAPAYAGKPGKTPLTSLPLYLLIGPEGSGKTSTFLNSGMEPVLLAGQVAGTTPLVSTRLCNLWLARNVIFAEISGRAFSGDIGTWTQLLRVLRGQDSTPAWRRFWRDPEQRLQQLHGVVAFCDVKEFTNASNAQRLERQSRDWQERLRAIGEVFCVEFPVYQVVSKGDAISFFADFFRRLPEPETNQILGCTLPLSDADISRRGGVSIEADIKRLSRTFSPLYLALAKRRLTHLAHEPDPSKRPGIYEFPREFKRIRQPLVQFLSDVFRPHPLHPGPMLRGYYLTGTVEVEVAPADLGGTRVDWSATNLGGESARLFRGDATRIFRPEDPSGNARPGGRGGLATRWLFVSNLFQDVILADQPARKTVPVDERMELYRRWAFGSVCALCGLLLFAFVWSWTENRTLLQEVHASGAGIPRGSKPDVFAELKSLDALRVQLQRLTDYDRNGAPLELRWGLYSGGRIITATRDAYFRRFQQLLLNDLNGAMVARLGAAPATPGPNAPYDRMYRVLKTHLMISSGSCKAEPALVAQVLKETREELPPLAVSDSRALADRQIEFYSSELPYGNPCRVTEDGAACDRARQYLQQIKGVERIYSGILANAEKSMPKAQRLGDLASNYGQVLNGQGEVSSVFTRDGWKLVEKASKESNSGGLGEPCVTGSSTAGYISERKQDFETAAKIQRLFVHDYVDRWRKFVAGFSVSRYSSAEDAARKLDILADHKSPLLALLAMTSNQTSFDSMPQEPDSFQKAKEAAAKFIPGLKKAEQGVDKVRDAANGPPDPLSTPADITRSFQPVHWVVPPASEIWVGEKNKAYIESLLQLRHSMEDIARGGATPDPAVHQAASQSYDKALDAVRQMATGFKPLGVEGLDGEVKRLLEEPILRTNGFIIRDMDKNAAGKVNGELRAFCAALKPALRKYPFQQTVEDLSLQELSKWFAPMTGEVWKFQAKSLAELTVKENSHWKPKDVTKKPLVTQEMQSFLDKSQAITDAFFPGGAAQPQLTYTLRPKDNGGDSILELDVDGQTHQWTTSLRTQFNWPAPPGVESGGRGRIKGKAMVVPFASRGGVWGIFRMMGDAEAREVDDKLVIWKYLRGGDGRVEPLDPPVRVEIVEFPGGADLFNRRFFQGYQCPAAAVQ